MTPSTLTSIFFSPTPHTSPQEPATTNTYIQLVQRSILHTCAANKCFLFALFIYFDSMLCLARFPLSFFSVYFLESGSFLLPSPPSEFRASKSKHGRPWTYLGAVPRACVDLRCFCRDIRCWSLMSIPALDELSVLQMFVILIGLVIQFERWGRPYPFERGYRGLESRRGGFGYPRLFSAPVKYDSSTDLASSIHQCSSNGFHPFRKTRRLTSPPHMTLVCTSSIVLITPSSSQR